MYSGFLHECIGGITAEDIESVTPHTASGEASPLQEYLQQSNLVLWGYVRTELEHLAPQDPSKKERVLLFVDNLFKIMESHDDRSKAEQILQLTAGQPTDVQ